MRLPAFLAGLFLCVLIFSAINKPVSAAQTDNLSINNAPSISDKNFILSLATLEPELSQVDMPKQHIVAKGENLTKIANLYETTWQRIYFKNLAIAHPDQINTGDTLVIPSPQENLPERTLPETTQLEQPVIKTASIVKQAKSNSHASSAGNSYTRGYCTWYAKNKRPDLPNNLGNANTWVARAQAQGIPTGAVPRAGAIGQKGMHVVYVERVNGDGTILVSEMNFRSWNVISSRTVPANYFFYIY